MQRFRCYWAGAKWVCQQFAVGVRVATGFIFFPAERVGAAGLPETIGWHSQLRYQSVLDACVVEEREGGIAPVGCECTCAEAPPPPP